jgi:uncharacterized protein (TIGR00730 family)
MSEFRSVCVYCGSSSKVDPRFLDIADRFGKAVAVRGLRMVYGGGNVGLMGASARAAHDNGAEVVGVIPRFLTHIEQPHPSIRTEVVETMHERKRRLFEYSDAFVVLPGGIGTLEEIVETLSWRRLSLHAKPCVFVDLTFWQGFFGLIEGTIEAGFTPPEFRNAYMAVETPEEALEAIEMSLSGAAAA